MNKIASDASQSAIAVSLVVCTRNRAEQLERCLKALSQLTCAPRWELIIVNNGSTDSTQSVIEASRSSLPCELTVLWETTPGLGRARNVGWRKARGEIIAFTDDDCYADPGYLEAILDVFHANPRLGFLGGQIRLFDPTDYRITIQELDQPQHIPPRSFIQAGLIQGANFSFRRSTLEEIGGIDENFGPGAYFNCEDIDAIARASAAGWEGTYDPRPIVYHHHGRKTEADVNRLKKDYARGRGAYYAKSMLNPIMRKTTLKNWYWNIRRSKSLGTTWLEIMAAIEYWGRRTATATAGIFSRR
jgi:glycosyltransferase involved in cell wall biosynthesis